jgi:hypothetical protein
VTDTRFAPGTATAYVTDAVLALSDAPGIDHELMHLCATSTEWATLADAARSLHVTALVMHDNDRLRLAVAGDASIVVETAHGDRRFDGTDTWSIGTVEQAQLVTLTADRRPGGDPSYRTDGGVVPASVVSRRLAAAACAPADPFELLFGHTVVRSVEAAAVRLVADDPGPRAALGVLVFDTGERVVVDRELVLGRNPRPVDEAADGPRPRLVQLSQPGVSRQHAVVRLDRWTASLEDLGSANGTTISSPGGPVNDVRPGRPVELAVGAVVDLGGELSFMVEDGA